MGFIRKTSAGPDKGESNWFKTIVTRIRKKRADIDEALVIGIDFGTTYSGAAWATVADFENNQINVITTWPGSGREEGKAPTELFYEHGQEEWGYGIPSDAEPVRWFKLLLLRDEDLLPAELLQAEYLLRARKTLREHNKTAVDLVADYLRCLWRHILETVQKARTKAVVDGLTFHVVITVPAIWKSYARQSMEAAARKAGILDPRLAGPTTLAFAPEPEAAALATMCEIGVPIVQDDVYVICDAGGGTVDLVSYRVGETDPIALHEAVPGTGGLCGGIFIDEAFENMCKARLGRQWSKLSQAGIKDIMRTEWEYAIKPQFDSRKEYIVSIPAEAFKGVSMNDSTREPIIKEGRIYFKSSDIRTAFTEVFSGIDELIDGQVKQAKGKARVKGIILVGGLGSSPYLYAHLSTRYSRQGIRILQATGVKPRTAICRGAIFKGFLDEGTQSTSETSHRQSVAPKANSAISVASTIARQSLGVGCSEHFDKRKHRREDREWDGDEETYFATGQMQWYLQKGQNVPKLKPVRHEFYRVWASEEEYIEACHELSVGILQCVADAAPSRRTRAVKDFCTITVEPRIDFEDLEDLVTDSGKVLKRLVFSVEMVPSGASIDFSIYHGDIKLGSKQARVDFS